jgi:hypothetical protein
MADWNGVRMQQALLHCDIVIEDRFTEVGPGPWYFLKLDNKLIPLGRDEHFCRSLEFALRRNARAFENRDDA